MGAVWPGVAVLGNCGEQPELLLVEPADELELLEEELKPLELLLEEISPELEEDDDSAPLELEDEDELSAEELELLEIATGTSRIKKSYRRRVRNLLIREGYLKSASHAGEYYPLNWRKSNTF